MRLSAASILFIALFRIPGSHADSLFALPLPVGAFEQSIHRAFTTEDGLPSVDVRRMTIDEQGRPAATTASGSAVWENDRWKAVETDSAEEDEEVLAPDKLAGLQNLAGKNIEIRGVAEHGGETAVAADTGLYIGVDGVWSPALPHEGHVRWAPVDVRAVGFDSSGSLWFAAPQGVGCRVSETGWRLFTGADGLPFNDFTCMATGPSGVWFGTTNGAVRYRDGAWSFRQGGRWLADDHVRSIAVDAEGSAWIATKKGASRISERRMTLAEKAEFYRKEIDRRHRRTDFGYVNPADLDSPGAVDSAAPGFTDNDGHNTGMYLGAVSLGYAATGDPELLEDAHRAFRALAFLSEVTQGGTHPAPEGFIARAVRPTSEPDPNPMFDLAYDLRRNQADALWKIIQPRWPIDESGEWYWKNDSSSDELDGHFFGYGIYFDRVCQSESEKEAVRTVVRRIADHLLRHGYNLVDHDGLPTRWARFSPDDLNRNEDWVTERGLNSFSILTYLSIAHHVTGDAKYREALLELALDHGYGMNGMTQPRDIAGPGTVGQPDDNMAFMNYYHLLRYETDPKLLSMFQHAIHRHWQIEKYEGNPFANFIYAACCQGKSRVDPWGEIGLSPPDSCYEEAVDTLKRYPLDLVDWPMSNAHRIDLKLLQDHLGHPVGKAGGGRDGRVFPIDERHEIYWDRDPWFLAYDGKGTRLREGFHYLLAYYMGLAHGFIQESTSEN